MHPLQPSLPAACFLAISALIPIAVGDETSPGAPVATHRVTGLFSRERVEDLRAIMVRQPQMELLQVDYDAAEATFRYDPAVVFPGAKPDKIVERFNEQLGHWSRGTFGIRPRSEIPRESLEKLEIGILGHDCKGCDLVAYEAVFKLEGVERATCSFREGRITVWHLAGKVTREQLETALRARQVRLTSDDPR